LRQLEDRLNLVQSLKRKYGGTLESVAAFGEKAAAQLAALEGRAEFLATLTQREKTARAALEKTAADLSKARKKIAGPLGEKISQELRALGFNKALFQIELTPAATKWNLFSRRTWAKRPARCARSPRAARWPA